MTNRWCTSDPRRPNDLSHPGCGHACGRTPSCTILVWRTRSDRWPNAWPHAGHTHGRSPPWTVRTCLSRLLRSPNAAWQVLHGKGRDFSWTLWMCLCRLTLAANPAPHVAHPCGRSLRWTASICFLRLERSVKRCPHSSHSKRLGLAVAVAGARGFDPPAPPLLLPLPRPPWLAVGGRAVDQGTRVPALRGFPWLRRARPPAGGGGGSGGGDGTPEPQAVLPCPRPHPAMARRRCRPTQTFMSVQNVNLLSFWVWVCPRSLERKTERS